MNDESGRAREMVEVEILGESYAIKSETGADYTKRVADYVDKMAREIRQESGVVDDKKVVILTALAVTDHLFRMRDGVDAVKGLSEKRAERLSNEVLAVIEQGSAD